MLKLLGIQLNPAVGAVIGIVALGLGLASDRPLITVIGAVLLVVSGVRAWNAWQGAGGERQRPGEDR